MAAMTVLQEHRKQYGKQYGPNLFKSLRENYVMLKY